MTRGTSLSCAVAFGLAGACLGCKSDSDPGAAFIGRYCDVYKPCCTAAGQPGDGAACRALFAGSSSQGKYDATAGDACIAGLMQQSGQPGFCDGSIVPPSDCARAFGATGTGGCLQDADCAPSSQGDVRCVSATINTQTMRKCQLQIHGSAGATPCVGSVRGGVTLYAGAGGADIPDQGYLCDAADGLRCDGTACVALTAEGAACELSSDCAVADFCDATTGTCAARKPIGAACIDQALECQDGAYCETTGMTCTAQLDVGAVCTDNVQCLTSNCPNGTCATIPTGGANPLCGG